MSNLANSMTKELTLRKSLLVPLGVFVLLLAFLWLGFGLKDPRLLPSVLIDKPFPVFELPDLHDPAQLRHREDLLGKMALVNVWATWCPNCLVEHPELLRISKEEGLPIYGINYNDDTAKALRWLERYEDPFAFSVVDKAGALVIDLGVYGAPETFLMDAKGVIRYRHVGPVTPEVWAQRFQPIIEHLRDEADAAG